MPAPRSAAGDRWSAGASAVGSSAKAAAVAVVAPSPAMTVAKPTPLAIRPAGTPQEDQNRYRRDAPTMPVKPVTALIEYVTSEPKATRRTGNGCSA